MRARIWPRVLFSRLEICYAGIPGRPLGVAYFRAKVTKPVELPVRYEAMNLWLCPVSRIHGMTTVNFTKVDEEVLQRT